MGGESRRSGARAGAAGAPQADAPAHAGGPPAPQFLQFRMKIINPRLERFRDRVEFSGNPSKYDVSVTLRDVQMEDEGVYSCYVMNPPDRHRGHGRITLKVLLEGEGAPRRLLRASSVSEQG